MGVLIAILTFLVVVVVFLAIWVFASAEGSQEQVRKRMSAVHKAERRGDVGLGIKLVRDEMMSSVPWLHQLMMKWSWSTRLQDYVMQAGISLKPAKLLMITLVLGLAVYLGAGHFLRSRSSQRYFQLLMWHLSAAAASINSRNIFRKHLTCWVEPCAPGTHLQPAWR